MTDNVTKETRGTDGQSLDFQWFRENYNELYRRYGKSYIAIKDKTVLGVYPTVGDAVRETAKKEKLGSFIVQFCDGTENAYTGYITSMNFMAEAV